MPKAIWNGEIIAEAPANATETVEGNVYFPLSAVKQDYLRTSDLHTTCPWKGVASYYDLEVNGQKNPGSAWYYPEPKAAAAQIKDFVAFWHGVTIEP
jgi:uncharacterized protein (DUF427 family)